MTAPPTLFSDIPPASAAPAATPTENRPQPSPSQRAAIEAPAGPLLVLAGPGAGKTFCLIERIYYLVETLGIPPERICAFTFTNRAAGEIAARLEQRLGARAELVKRGTIHAFCAELLREFGEKIDLPPGFGIADDEYQMSVLRRIGVPRKLQRSVLGAFTLFRLRGEPMSPKYTEYYHQYSRFLKQQSVADFDTLVLEAQRLLGHPEVLEAARARWSAILVDEFQDLNPVQYAIMRDLVGTHRHLFAVGDHEQSIYSWAGADPEVFKQFAKDFEIKNVYHLQENRRCPKNIFARARSLVERNTNLFDEQHEQQTERVSPFGVVARGFAHEDAELAWLLDDIRSDHLEHGLPWGEYAILYRKHEIGNLLEASLLGAGVPCRLAQGRALSEDPVAGYVIAALRAIAAPKDDVHHERFLEVVLPKGIVHDARAKAEEAGRSVLAQLEEMARTLKWDHPDAKKLRRAFYDLKNLAALGARHTSLGALVEELLSHRVGAYKSVLEERHEEVSDPARDEEVLRLAERLEQVIATDGVVWMPRLGGAEIALRGLLMQLGVRHVKLGGDVAPTGSEPIVPANALGLGLPLALFKAAQLVRSREFTNAFRDFTAVDLETTGRDVTKAEIVEVAAVRVRNGKRVDEFHAFVKPRVAIEHGAAKTHGITADQLADKPYFEDVWPKLQAFLGNDLVVAHNGYTFDFPILRRMASALPDWNDFLTYDTLPLARELHATSRKLEHLAPIYGIDPGQSHSALDDTRTLAGVFLGLSETKIERARKTSLVNLLDHVALALSLCDTNELCDEAKMFLQVGRGFALGRFSDCLEMYKVERDAAGDPSLPTMEDVIDRLGGEALMQRIRADKSAADRYPAAMLRLRRLLAVCSGDTLADQMMSFLERVALSAKSDGAQAEHGRVNLLTLHSTKGLEFSRVYILGVEDSELPGSTPQRGRTVKETEEARRLLYVGMTRAKDRLVLTRCEARGGKPTGGWQFLAEMELEPA